jgi:hypothetical protein
MRSRRLGDQASHTQNAQGRHEGTRIAGKYREAQHQPSIKTLRPARLEYPVNPSASSRERAPEISQTRYFLVSPRSSPEVLPRDSEIKGLYYLQIAIDKVRGGFTEIQTEILDSHGPCWRYRIYAQRPICSIMEPVFNYQAAATGAKFPQLMAQ